MIMGKQNVGIMEMSFSSFNQLNRGESLKTIYQYITVYLCSYVVVPAAELNCCCRIAYQVWNSLDL
jgi:hypothetical protein